MGCWGARMGRLGVVWGDARARAHVDIDNRRPLDVEAVSLSSHALLACVLPRISLPTAGQYFTQELGLAPSIASLGTQPRVSIEHSGQRFAGEAVCAGFGFQEVGGAFV